MKKTLFNSAYLFAAIAFLSFSGCGKDDDDNQEPHNHDEELITTLKLTFQDKNDATAAPIIAQFKDADGNGTGAPVITGATLQAGKTYVTTIALLDESKAAPHHLTHEIEEEGVDHQFFFTITPAGLLTVTPTDKDANNKPIGLKADAVTQVTPGTGSLKVILKHQPGSKNGDANTGSTDIDVDFPVTVQ